MSKRRQALGLRDSIQWIADNDNAGDNEPPDVLDGYATVALVADIFGKLPSEIANRVYALRNPR